MRRASISPGINFNMRPIALLILFLAPAVLACDLNVRAHTTELPSSIEWDRYIGAFSYLVTESSDGFVTTRTYEVPTNSFTIPHRVSEVTKFSYRVEAHFETDQVIDGSCRGAIELALRPDPQFRKMTRKVIVPIVCSVVGATGAKFRTSLRITSTTGQPLGEDARPAGTGGVARRGHDAQRHRERQQRHGGQARGARDEPQRLGVEGERGRRAAPSAGHPAVVTTLPERSTSRAGRRSA